MSFGRSRTQKHQKIRAKKNIKITICGLQRSVEWQIWKKIYPKKMLHDFETVSAKIRYSLYTWSANDKL